MKLIILSKAWNPSLITKNFAFKRIWWRLSLKVFAWTILWLKSHQVEQPAVIICGKTTQENKLGSHGMCLIVPSQFKEIYPLFLIDLYCLSYHHKSNIKSLFFSVILNFLNLQPHCFFRVIIDYFLRFKELMLKSNSHIWLIFNFSFIFFLSGLKVCCQMIQFLFFIRNLFFH